MFAHTHKQTQAHVCVSVAQVFVNHRQFTDKFRTDCGSFETGVRLGGRVAGGSAQTAGGQQHAPRRRGVRCGLAW